MYNKTAAVMTVMFVMFLQKLQVKVQLVLLTGTFRNQWAKAGKLGFCVADKVIVHLGGD